MLLCMQSIGQLSLSLLGDPNFFHQLANLLWIVGAIPQIYQSFALHCLSLPQFFRLLGQLFVLFFAFKDLVLKLNDLITLCLSFPLPQCLQLTPCLFEPFLCIDHLPVDPLNTRPVVILIIPHGGLSPLNEYL